MPNYLKKERFEREVGKGSLNETLKYESQGVKGSMNRFKLLNYLEFWWGCCQIVYCHPSRCRNIPLWLGNESPLEFLQHVKTDNGNEKPRADSILPDGREVTILLHQRLASVSPFESIVWNDDLIVKLNRFFQMPTQPNPINFSSIKTD